MPDTSPLTIITNQIITLLVGNGSNYFATAIPAGNRFTKLSGVRWPVQPKPNARNLPRFIIDVSRGQQSPSDRNLMKTFCNVNSSNGDIVMRLPFNFTFKVIFLGLDRSLGNQLLYFMTGVLLADPKLGLTTPTISSSGALTEVWQEVSNDDTGGQLGLVLTITFPVTVQMNRADLVAAAAYTG